ncbi:MAG TPA: OsmC family protein [Desulfomonilia bacterium]
MGVEISIVYEGDLHCTAEHSISGQKIITDAPLDNGGRGEAFSPTDLVGAALGTCIITVMDLVAKRSGIDLKGTKVHVIKDMTSIPARRIGKLTVEITYPEGLNLSEADRTKLEKTAHTCPVKQSLCKDVEVVINFSLPS